MTSSAHGCPWPGLIAVFAWAAVADRAAAAPGYLFNKPGVTREAYVADASECSELAGGKSYRAEAAGRGTTYVTYPNTTPGAVGTALGLILVAIISRDPRKQVAELVERTCMADKGYGRIKVSPKLRRAIEREPDKAVRVDRFFAFASAAHPELTALDE